jgi:hypothetical protein
MKNNLSLFVGLLSLVAESASAAAVYGTVLSGGAPAASVTISVACPAFTGPGPSGVIEATTDARGSYSLGVPATGRCEMRVRRGSATGATFTVVVSDNPLRFDFEIDAALNRVR